jgi:transcriptional regulator with XRE-family HTH domain
VGKASITNLLPGGRAGQFSQSLGSELRRRRIAARLSQDEMSRPLTRAFISQVESGRSMPSLPALIVMSERLGTSADEVLKAVNQALSSEYPVAHANGRPPKSRG